jgi:RNA polymerase sigma factor for flagellar operon FliA
MGFRKWKGCAVDGGGEGEAGVPPKDGGDARLRRDPLTQEQKNLAAEYVPLARKLVKPLKQSWPNEGDEFESAAMFALVEAARSFEVSRNVKFATFARYRIWGALQDAQRALVALRRRSDQGRTPVVNDLLYGSQEQGRVCLATNDPPVGDELEAAEAVEAWLRKLPEQHAAACRGIYVDGRTQCETAVRLGVSKSRVSYLHKQALVLLGEAVADRDRGPEKKAPGV